MFNSSKATIDSILEVLMTLESERVCDTPFLPFLFFSVYCVVVSFPAADRYSAVSTFIPYIIYIYIIYGEF